LPVTRDAAYVGDFNLDPNEDDTFVDPSHEVPSVHNQLFRGSPDGKPSNEGFVWDYSQQKKNTVLHSGNILKCYAPDSLPVVTALAREFAICDHWHASIPGPTWPNRLFVHAATSAGHVDNQFHEDDYNIDTIYDRLDQKGQSWKIYFHDLPQSLALVHLQRDFIIKNKFRLFQDFLEDARQGKLPAYSFIEPRYTDFLFLKANDQHPPHNVALGEHLIADVYEAVRRSPQWPQTLLVILWDEHGGTYDHVPPPLAENPDGKVSVNPAFNFDLLGVRVPALIVSPYVKRGAIDSRVYDHTSLLATVEKRFGLGSLTNRDRAANTFEGLLNLDVPRDDTPTSLNRPVDETAKKDHGRSMARVAQMTSEMVRASLDAGQFAKGSASEFQLSLVKLTKHLLIKGETAVAQTLRLSQWSDMEHDAAH